jgi:hypothetical protein
MTATNARDVLDGIKVRAKAYTEHGTPGLAAPQDRAHLIAAVDAVLAKHKPEKRWTHPDWTGSFDSREEAAEYDYDEAMDDDQKSQVDHFEVCAECGHIEAEQLRESGDEWSYRESLWPCRTVAAIENALTKESQ